MASAVARRAKPINVQRPGVVFVMPVQPVMGFAAVFAGRWLHDMTPRYSASKKDVRGALVFVFLYPLFTTFLQNRLPGIGLGIPSVSFAARGVGLEPLAVIFAIIFNLCCSVCADRSLHTFLAF